MSDEKAPKDIKDLTWTQIEETIAESLRALLGAESTSCEIRGIKDPTKDELLPMSALFDIRDIDLRLHVRKPPKEHTPLDDFFTHLGKDNT